MRDIFQELASLSSKADCVIEREFPIHDAPTKFLDEQFNKISFAISSGKNPTYVISEELEFQERARKNFAKSCKRKRKNRGKSEKIHLRGKSSSAAFKSCSSSNVHSPCSVKERPQVFNQLSSVSEADSTFIIASLKNTPVAERNTLYSKSDFLNSEERRREIGFKILHVSGFDLPPQNNPTILLSSENSDAVDSRNTSQVIKTSNSANVSSPHKAKKSVPRVLFNIKPRDYSTICLSSEKSDAAATQNPSRRETFVVNKPTKFTNKSTVDVAEDESYFAGSSSYTTTTSYFSTQCNSPDDSVVLIKDGGGNAVMPKKPLAKAKAARGRPRKKQKKNECSDDARLQTKKDVHKKVKADVSNKENHICGKNLNDNRKSKKLFQCSYNIRSKRRKTEVLLKAAAKSLATAIKFNSNYKDRESSFATSELTNDLQVPVARNKVDGNHPKVSLHLKMQEKKRIREERMRKTKEAREKLQKERAYKIRISEQRRQKRLVQIEEQIKNRKSKVMGRELRSKKAKLSNIDYFPGDRKSNIDRMYGDRNINFTHVPGDRMSNIDHVFGDKTKNLDYVPGDLKSNNDPVSKSTKGKCISISENIYESFPQLLMETKVILHDHFKRRKTAAPDSPLCGSTRVLRNGKRVDPRKTVIISKPVTQKQLKKKELKKDHLKKVLKKKDLKKKQTPACNKNLEEIHEAIYKPVSSKPDLSGPMKLNTESCSSNLISTEVSRPDDDTSTSSYKISEFRSDSDSDDQDCEAQDKKFPQWTSGLYLKQAVIKQQCNAPDLTFFFGEFHDWPIDLSEMFNDDKPSYHYRTSSANWDIE